MSNISESSSEEDDSSTVESETISTEESSRAPKNMYRPRANVYKPNPYFLNQSTYFQQSLREQFSNKNKTLSFIEKDLFLLNNYEPSLFKNSQHAVEVFSAYHIYNKMVDDLKFEGSTVNINLLNEMNSFEQRFNGFMEGTLLNKSHKKAFLSQLLLFHEQRYFLSKVDQDKRRKYASKKVSDQTDKKQRINKKVYVPKGPKMVRKKRSHKGAFLCVFKMKPRNIHLLNLHKYVFKVKKNDYL